MTPDLLDPASDLLSAAHRNPHASGCAAALSDLTVARQRLEPVLTMPAVAALSQGRLIGYLAAQPPRPPGQSSRIKPAFHATRPDRRREIYRQLYTGLAGQLTRIGGFSHTITVGADDSDAVATWFELGFGADQVKGVQRVRPIETTNGPPVREAGVTDLDAMIELAIELTRFHAESPMLRPALSDHDQIRAGFVHGIADERSLVAVVDLGDSLGGFLQVHADSHYLDTATIGIAGVTRAGATEVTERRCSPSRWPGRPGSATDTAPLNGPRRIPPAIGSGAAAGSSRSLTSSPVGSMSESPGPAPHSLTTISARLIFEQSLAGHDEGMRERNGLIGI